MESSKNECLIFTFLEGVGLACEADPGLAAVEEGGDGLIWIGLLKNGVVKE